MIELRLGSPLRGVLKDGRPSVSRKAAGATSSMMLRRTTHDPDGQRGRIELAHVSHVEVVPDDHVQKCENLDQQDERQKPDAARHAGGQARDDAHDQEDDDRSVADGMDEVLPPRPLAEQGNAKEYGDQDLVEVSELS